MKKEFDKKEFIRAINSIPWCIKTREDLIEFCKYLQYSFLRAGAINQWYEENFELNYEELEELTDIQMDHDWAYMDDHGKYLSFIELS